MTTLEKLYALEKRPTNHQLARDLNCLARCAIWGLEKDSDVIGPKFGAAVVRVATRIAEVEGIKTKDTK